MSDLKLYMILLECTPKGRFTEQHDIFFGVGKNMADLKPAIKQLWAEAPAIHIDAWREVNAVDGCRITVVEQKQQTVGEQQHLFFINLGGYKPQEFEEFNYKIITVAKETSKAIQTSKKTAFFKHIGFPGAPSHVDEKFGIDVDGIFNIKDILSGQYKDRYSLQITEMDDVQEDPMHLGYLTWKNIR